MAVQCQEKSNFSIPSHDWLHPVKLNLHRFIPIRGSDYVLGINTVWPAELSLATYYAKSYLTLFNLGSLTPRPSPGLRPWTPSQPISDLSRPPGGL